MHRLCCALFGRCLTPAPPVPTILPQSNKALLANAIHWPISNHFENCSKFEQSFPKMMTRRPRWSRKMPTGWATAPEPDGPSLGRSPGAQQAASSRRQDQIETSRENRVDTIFRAGPECPALFFVQACCVVAARHLRDRMALHRTGACSGCVDHRSSQNALRARHMRSWRLRCNSFRLRSEPDSMPSCD